MYNSKKKAEKFWSKRLRETDELSAVLSFGSPDYVNKAYSKWKIELVLGVLHEFKNKKILDLACRIARVTIPLAKKGARLTGMDISQKMLDICSENVRLSGVEENVELKMSDAVNIPSPDTAFDIVLCLGLIEHLPLNILKATKESSDLAIPSKR